jgi:hypothetical protein
MGLVVEDQRADQEDEWPCEPEAGRLESWTVSDRGRLPNDVIAAFDHRDK